MTADHEYHGRSGEADNFRRIKEARDHHDSTCPLGPAIEVHMNPFDIYERMEWEEGDTIAGLTLIANPHVVTDVLRIICAGDRDSIPAPSAKTKPLPQPRTVEVPDVIPEREFAYARAR